VTLTYTELFDFIEDTLFKVDYIPPPKPSEWLANNFIDPVTEGPMDVTDWQARILDEALQVDGQGYSKYDLVIWSQPKKSGKTTIAGGVGAYVAHNIESPNEVSCVANDQEQSAGRIFSAMMPTLKKLGWVTPVSIKSIFRDPTTYGPNKSVVKAITTNYEKEAGGNQGLSLWSELWAYKGERLTRLWEEMTPPPTRRFSMRWVESYAGFIGENLLFQEIFLKIFRDFTESELSPGAFRLFDDLPVYICDNGSTLVFWDHEHRMPWQTEEYYAKQKDKLRESSYIRLHENRWVDSADTFITYEMWVQSARIDIPRRRSIYALDANKNNDCAALVGCVRQGDTILTTDCHIWEPENGKDMDFQKIHDTVVRLYKTGLLHPPLYYDPYQCVKLAQDLRSLGVPCQQFNQGQDRIKSDTFLFKMYKEGKIFNPGNNQLRRHILAASAKYYDDERIRIIKPDESEQQGLDRGLIKKVDAAVAQSMAAYKAYLRKSGGWAITGQDKLTTDSIEDIDELI